MQTRNKVLIVTHSEEPNVPRVLSLLNQMGVSVVRLNTDQLLPSTNISFFQKGGYEEWKIGAGGKVAKSEEVRSIWYRRPPSPKAPRQVAKCSRDFVEGESRNFLWSLWSVLDREKIFWMNHPLQLKLLEFNKLFQMQVAASVGLRVPKTLVTTSPVSALSFVEGLGGEAALKIFGGGILKDSRGNLLSIFTNKISAEDVRCWGEKSIPFSPVMLQEYIPKEVELRITAVGEKIFACAIHSQDSPRTRDDWRHYDFPRVRHEEVSLPRTIHDQLLEIMMKLRISFGAIDMVITPDGKYVFLEVNPSGQWGWIEHLTGMPISKAIAETLANPPSSQRGS